MLVNEGADEGLNGCDLGTTKKKRKKNKESEEGFTVVDDSWGSIKRI